MKIADLTIRPIRPEEINNGLTVATRIYNSVIAAVNTRILGAAADAIVRTGSVYVFFGWFVIEDPTGVNRLGLNSVGQIVVEGVVKNEIALPSAFQSPDHMVWTFDQMVIIGEQTSFTIQARGAAAGQGIIYPLGYRIGPKSQLDQG